MQPLDLVEASAWKQAAFTTYALSLSFFEAVILDALVRGGGRNAVIFADPEGVRAGLSEQGARRAGRDYEIEPVVCSRGCFHPKITALIGDNDGHLLVGSGNLTFGGWGGNLELIEHLHPSFAADAFDDAADFFELLPADDSIRTGGGDATVALAQALRRAAGAAPRTGRIRLAHSIGGAIADDIVRFATDLGGATRITFVSPFFDRTGNAIKKLAEALGCTDVRVHVHPGPVVRGAVGQNWPATLPIPVKPVCVKPAFADDGRPLHAKAIEIQCRRGRLIVSGSANATSAALFGGNVEASVIRIHRPKGVGWTAAAAAPPLAAVPMEEEDEEAATERAGVLRATLHDDQIRGLVLTPAMRGEASIRCITTADSMDMGTVTLDAGGAFDCSAPGLETQSWIGGRLVLRIEQGDRRAEGFISVVAASELIRRAGALAPRLMAMLGGTETPGDVAAILAWFREDPSRLPQIASIGGGGASDDEEASATFVSLAQLHGTAAAVAPSESDSEGRGSGEAGWRRAMALLRSVFAQPRGPWAAGGETDDDDDEDDRDRERRAGDEEKYRRRSFEAFEDLLPVMLHPGHGGRHAGLALAMAHYLADRFRPGAGTVMTWLQRLIGQLPVERGNDHEAAVAAGLLYHGVGGQTDGELRARRFLLRAGIDPGQMEAPADAFPAFSAILAPSWDPGAFLERVRKVRAPGEQVRAYLHAADQGGPRDGYELLIRSPLWPKLLKGLDDATTRARFHVMLEIPRSCPWCRLQLPRASIEDLQAHGVASCCGRILLYEAP